MQIAHSILKVRSRVFVCTLIVVTSASAAFAQASQNQIQALPPGQTLERDMTGAETHRYQVDLQKDEFFQVRVAQKGVDVTLKLKDSSGQMLATMDSPNGKEGPETLSFVAEKSGRFTLEVIGLDAKAEKGNYSIKREVPRNATERDRKRVDIERVFVEGVKAANTLGQTEVALAKLSEALKGLRELGDKYLADLTERVELVSESAAVGNLVHEAIRLRQEGKAESILFARAKFAEAVDAANKLFTKLNEDSIDDIFTRHDRANIKELTKKNEMNALWGMASTYDVMKQWPESVTYYERALTVLDEMRRSPEIANSQFYSSEPTPLKLSEATLLHAIGTTLSLHMKKNQEGLAYAERSLALWRQIVRDEDQKFRVYAEIQEAAEFILIAQSYVSLDDRSNAAINFIQALEIYKRRQEERNSLAATLVQLGNLYSGSLDYEKARSCWNDALTVYESLGNKASQQQVLGLFGLSYFLLGDESKAREYFGRALVILESDDYVNEVQKELTASSVPIAPEIKTDTTNISNLYRANYEWQRFTSIGDIHAVQGENDKALPYFEKALDAGRTAENPEFIRLSLSSIGSVYSNQNNWSRALYYYQQALDISRQFPQRSDLASDLSSVAHVHIQAKQWSEALQAATEELLIYQSLGADKNSLFIGYSGALNMIARAQDELGNRRLAIFYEKQAVNAIQRERQQLRNLDIQSQRGYSKRVEKPYRRLAEWLTKEGRIPEAEQVMRMLKEDEYFQFLRRDYQVAKDLLFTVGLEPDEAAAAERYDHFADKLTTIGREYGELAEEKKKPEYERRPFPKQARLDELDKMLNDARVVSQKFLDDLDEKFKQKDVRVAEIKSGFQSMLKDMNARRTAIVSTLVDDDRLTIFITTADSQRAHAVDIKAADVNKLVADFRAAVMNPKIDPRDAGKKLYDIVIAPIERDLVGINADTIVWSLDGTLRYAPMAALWDGQHYLAERYANVVITLASQKYLEQAISDKTKWRALGVGVSKGFEGFPALQAVPDELDCVITDPMSRTVSLHPQCQRGIINGTKLLDDRFTKESFKNALGRYAVVHIASHFSLQPGDAYRSFLLLGGGATEKDRKLMVSEINQSLFSGVEILTLSACNTAVGTERSNGLEVEGFGALAQKEGAKSVIATLWEVADPSTRDFMVKFYSLYDSPASVNKAQALRQAQLALLRGGARNAQSSNTVRSSIRLDAENAPKTFTPEPNAKYSHPYYWAPFILIGNWK